MIRTLSIYSIFSSSYSQDQPMFAVGLNPRRKTVEFSIPKYDRTVQTLTWEVPQVFTDEWQKIHFGVYRDKVVLYVNCQPVSYINIQLINGS